MCGMVLMAAQQGEHRPGPGATWLDFYRAEVTFPGESHAHRLASCDSRKCLGAKVGERPGGWGGPGRKSWGKATARRSPPVTRAGFPVSPETREVAQSHLVPFGFTQVGTKYALLMPAPPPLPRHTCKVSSGDLQAVAIACGLPGSSLSTVQQIVDGGGDRRRGQERAQGFTLA